MTSDIYSCSFIKYRYLSELVAALSLLDPRMLRSARRPPGLVSYLDITHAAL
jgi:hypothetical protein